MKSRGSSARALGGTAQVPSQLPIAWMDPMSWRLPSGKALAEFALQSGFLAPLMLGGPVGKRKKILIPVKSLGPVEKHVEERPGSSGTFRQTR